MISFVPVGVVEAYPCLSVPRLRDRDVCGGAEMGERHFDDALVSRQHAIVPIAVFSNIHLFHIAVTSVVECFKLKSGPDMVSKTTLQYESAEAPRMREFLD